MCRLIESIKVINGQFENIHFHNLRFNNARASLWNIKTELDLTNEVVIPPALDNGLYKCRIIYAEEIEKVEIVPYQLPVIRSLKIINDDNIIYDYKYEGRTQIASLFERREDCDDILIIKNSCLTDSSFCNVVLYDEEKYYTPSTPLLNGTKRKQLLSQKKIIEKKIELAELKKFQSIYLINAMIDIEDNICIDTKEVY